ncbi:translocation protein [Phellopilus nigrolimitatus]|nr:translocation protein [Phellopilus nigrolimitatus]
MEQQQKAPSDIRAVVAFLRGSKAGIKTRVGVLNGKRVDYFKGKAAVKALLSPAYAKLKRVPPVPDEAAALALLNTIIPFAFYLRVDRPAPPGAPGAPSAPSSGGPKHLALNPLQTFRAGDLYAWFYDGPLWTTYLGALAMVALLLAGVMFPLWPPPLRLGVWYLSIAVLALIALFLAVAVLRLIFYVASVVLAPPGIWVFPKLFADVGVIESFIPFWEWDLPKKKKSKKRADDDAGAKKDRKGKGKERAAPADAGAGAGAGAYIEEVESSASNDSRPATAAAARVTVEDAPADEEEE